jgi:integrase
MSEERRTFAFTETRLRNLNAPPQREYYADTRTRGFKLAVYPSGAKAFLIYRRVHGRPERIFIGRWPDLTVEQARKIAEQTNGLIAKGENPAQQQRQKKLEGTLSNLFERYLELHARPHKQPRSVIEDERNFKRYLASWSARRLSSILRRDVERRHAEIGQKHGKYAANRALALLSSMFNKAIDWGWSGSNPVVGIKKFAEEERERFLTQAEMPRFLHALAQESDPDFRDYTVLGLLTGARTSNLLAMRWQEIDTAEAVWRIPRTKGNKPQTIPLVGPAVAILLRRREQANGEWVFPSGKVLGEHVKVFRTQWTRLLQRAELADLRPHDVRRTLGSWMMKGGTSLPIVKKALGHQDLSTTLIYTRSEDGELRRALEATATRMLEAGDAKTTAC